MPWHIADGFAPEFHMVNPKENAFREFDEVKPYLESRIRHLWRRGSANPNMPS